MQPIEMATEVEVKERDLEEEKKRVKDFYNNVAVFGSKATFFAGNNSGIFLLIDYYGLNIIFNQVLRTTPSEDINSPRVPIWLIFPL